MFLEYLNSECLKTFYFLWQPLNRISSRAFFNHSSNVKDFVSKKQKKGKKKYFVGISVSCIKWKKIKIFWQKVFPKKIVTRSTKKHFLWEFTWNEKDGLRKCQVRLTDDQREIRAEKRNHASFVQNRLYVQWYLILDLLTTIICFWYLT
jgi:hypothetical protein